MPTVFTAIFCCYFGSYFFHTKQNTNILGLKSPPVLWIRIFQFLGSDPVWNRTGTGATGAGFLGAGSGNIRSGSEPDPVP